MLRHRHASPCASEVRARHDSAAATTLRIATKRIADTQQGRLRAYEVPRSRNHVGQTKRWLCVQRSATGSPGRKKAPPTWSQETSSCVSPNAGRLRRGRPRHHRRSASQRCETWQQKARRPRRPKGQIIAHLEWYRHARPQQAPGTAPDRQLRGRQLAGQAGGLSQPTAHRPRSTQTPARCRRPPPSPRHRQAWPR